MAITLRPRVPTRAQINKHKPDTPLQPLLFAMSLHNHPDHMFLESLLWSLCHDFNLGYTGARYLRLSFNQKSALEHKVIVQRGLDLECERSHMPDPYNKPLLPTLQCSGVDVVPKKNGSWRLITHLTGPRGLSINDGIDLEKYKQIDNAICLHETDRTWLLNGKDGLNTHAFRLRSICREDWDLLRVYWNAQYHVDNLSCACPSIYAPHQHYLINQVADVLEWILVNECHINRVLHYLDHFFFVEPENSTCRASMTRVKDKAHQLGVLMEPSKKQAGLQP